MYLSSCCFFFFNDTATTEIYTNLNTLSLHDALPIWPWWRRRGLARRSLPARHPRSEEHTSELQSHSEISYAVFCLKKKKKAKPKKYLYYRCAPQTHPFINSYIVYSGLLVESYTFLTTCCSFFFFFFNDTATTEIYTNLNTLSLHDALPICPSCVGPQASLGMRSKAV